MEDTSVEITAGENAETIDLPADELAFPVFEDFAGLNFAYIITLPLHPVHVHDQITSNNVLDPDSFEVETKPPLINESDNFIVDTKCTTENSGQTNAETKRYSSTSHCTLNDGTDPVTNDFEIFNVEVKSTPTNEPLAECYPTISTISEVVLPSVETKPCISITLTPPSVTKSTNVCSSVVTNDLNDISQTTNQYLEEDIFLHEVLSTETPHDVVLDHSDAATSAIDVEYVTEISNCNNTETQYNEVLVTTSPSTSGIVNGALSDVRDERNLSGEATDIKQVAEENSGGENLHDVGETKDDRTASYIDDQKTIDLDRKPVRTYGKLKTNQQNVSPVVDDSTCGTKQLIVNASSISSPHIIQILSKPLTCDGKQQESPHLVPPKPIPVRKRRLILDIQKQIPIPAFKKQLLNTKDIVNVKSDLAPGTRRAMKYLECGSVSQIFSSSGRPIRSTPICRLFTNNLVMVAQSVNSSNDSGNVAPLDGDLNITNFLENETCGSSKTQPSTLRLIKDCKSLEYQFKGVRHLKRPPVYKEYQRIQLKHTDGKQRTYSYKRKSFGISGGHNFASSKVENKMSACTAENSASTDSIEEIVYTVEDDESLVLKSHEIVNFQPSNAQKRYNRLRELLPKKHEKVKEELDPDVEVKKVTEHGIIENGEQTQSPDGIKVEIEHYDTVLSSDVSKSKESTSNVVRCNV